MPNASHVLQGIKEKNNVDKQLDSVRQKIADRLNNAVDEKEFLHYNFYDCRCNSEKKDLIFVALREEMKEKGYVLQRDVLLMPDNQINYISLRFPTEKQVEQENAENAEKNKPSAGDIMAQGFLILSGISILLAIIR